MATSWRPAGISFTLRLLTLVLVPLVGLGVLAAQRIDDQRESAATALSLVDDARRQQEAAAVYGPAQLEQMALEGMATVDALGLPRVLVVDVTGVDFELTYDENAATLDHSLDRLAARHGTFVLADGSTLGTRLGFVRGNLATQRQLSATLRAERAEVRRVFAQLNLLLAEAIGSTPPTGDVGADRAGNRQIELTALSEVLVAAGDRGEALFDALINRSDVSTMSISNASTRLDLAIERYGKVADPGEMRGFLAVTEMLQPIPPLLLDRGNGDSSAADFDVEYISISANVLLAQVDFQTALESYSNDVHTSVVTDLETHALAAETSAWRTQLLLALTIGIGALILILLSWSTLRPLRRLTKRAQAVSDGVFDAEPLPIRGPSDVRTLTRAMNSMTTTLQAIDHGIADLARGTLVEERPPLPGTIGVSIAQSFQRLESTAARLHESEQLASAIVAQAADAIWTVDEHGVITSANNASVGLLGIPSSEQMGEPLKAFLPRLDGEMTVYTPNGESTHILAASSEITGGPRPLTAVIAHDISERTRFEERLAYQAHHDALTGLPNRFAVLEELGCGDQHDALTVLFIDLDGFKSVNDTQGHVAGDRVLTEVGRRLTEQVRPGDFVGRLGGDEFVVVMSGSDQSRAVAFAERIIGVIEQPFQDDDHFFALSASVGVATFPNGLDADQLSPLEAIRRADSAVYAAKHRGRGCVELFDAKLQQQIVRDAEIEIALGDAVRNDELELELQPVFDVTSGRFAAAEALVRWNRPGIGRVPPVDFIPIAERSSLINEIGRWVLDQACVTLARWSRDPALNDVRIAVNVAGSHLLDGDLVADLDATIGRTGADPTLLEFEVTETQLVDDHQRAAAVLCELRSRGPLVAIDDFGTGYSSMAYLRELPIDILKIDGSFVTLLAESDAETIVLDALVTIGHSLGLAVVAEGIEQASQVDDLVSRGCDRLQGFHLARPMSVAEAELWLTVPPAWFEHPRPASAVVSPTRC